MLTHESLKNALSYDHATGIFTRRVRSSNNIRAGDRAGTVDIAGYRYISVLGHRYSAHRLAWLYMTGAWPQEEVDHRNGRRDDNRWSNLRQATRGQNCQNIGTRCDNTSGYAGVSWDGAKNKWRAQIRANKSYRIIGRFDSPSDAHAAYLRAKATLHTFNPVPRGT